MFSSVSNGSPSKQPLLFLASLGLQCSLVVLLCLIPPPKSHGCCLRKENLSAAMSTPVFLPPLPPEGSAEKPAPSLKQLAPAPEVPSTAKPLEAKLTEPKPAEPKPVEAKPVETKPVEAKLAEPEVKPAEESPTAAANDETSPDVGFAPFAAQQMRNSNAHGMHHQVKSALPVFTPEPEILHGAFPEPARGKEVVLNVVINEQGSIVAVEVRQGIGYGVEQSIVETLKRWIYVPAKFNGVAITSQQELRFQFPG